MRVLSNHGLVGVDTSLQEQIESRGYNVHGCVHSWTIHVLNQEWDYNLARVALKFIGSHIPSKQDIQPWPIQRRLLQHASRCSYIVLNGLVPEDGIEWAFHQLGVLYYDQGKMDEAEKMYLRALHGKEKAWGLDHTSTLNTVNNLGLLYSDQGKMDEAEKMYLRALQGYEKAWGLDHTSPLNTVNNLGNFYQKQGKMDEAEKMYLRALQGKEKAWGLDHTSTLNTVNNLGILYRKQGKMDEAKKMYLRALQGYEIVFGQDHPHCLVLRESLNTLYIEVANNTLIDTGKGGPEGKPEGKTSPLVLKETPSNSRRHKLLRKLHLRQ
jgi:tetratricopeptide (TPR) repeat protein